MILCTLSVPIPCDVCLSTATSLTPFHQLKANLYSDGFGACTQNCKYTVGRLAVFRLDHYTGIDDKEWVTSVNESFNPVYVSSIAYSALRTSLHSQQLFSTL